MKFFLFVETLLFLFASQQPLVLAWRSYCDSGVSYTSLPGVDCQSPVTKIDKCYCDREVPSYKRCVKDALDELNSEEANATVVAEISVILQRLSKWDKLEPEVLDLVWQLFDKLLFVRQEVFIESNDLFVEDETPLENTSTKRFLSSLNQFLIQSDQNTSFLVGSNFALAKKPRPKCGNQVSLGIADFGDHFGEVNGFGEDSKALASIEVPIEASCQEKDRVKRDAKDDSVYFVLYRNPSFFLGNSTEPSNARFGRHTGDRNLRCQPGLFADDNQIVLSASVGDKGLEESVFDGDKKMAIIRYRKQLPPLHGKFMVSWWQRSLAKWALNGTCKITHQEDMVEAECFHLTDFTLLVDGMETDPTLCDNVLISLGCVLNIGSFLALLLLNVIYIVYKSPRLYQRVFVEILRLPKVHLDDRAIFYNVTLMVFFYSFGVFSDERHTGGGGVFCRMVAAFNYWLLLACILLTIFQGWHILKMFLLTVEMERLIILITRRRVVLAVSFGVPALFCVLFGLSVDNFFYRNDEFCWIRPNYVWFAVVLPLSLLVLNAILCSIIILFRLFPNSCGMKQILERHTSATIRLSKGTRRKSRNRLAVLLIMQFTLGMPWIFQYATLSVPHVSLTHYLFTLVNGSQGLILLCLFAYKQIQTWRAARIKTECECEKPPGAESEVFTNSIGMRIPVAKSSTNQNTAKKDLEIESKNGKY